MKISQQIFPRVVCLIVSINKNNQPNVMTASFVMPISFEPKYLGFSISEKRYTFQNLREVPEFTLNLLNKEMKKEAIICGTFSGRNMNKFEKAGLITEKSNLILPPTIKCPVSFECKIVEMNKFGDHFLIVGEVLEEWVREENFVPLLHKSSDIFMKPEVLE